MVSIQYLYCHQLGYAGAIVALLVAGPCHRDPRSSTFASSGQICPQRSSTEYRVPPGAAGCTLVHSGSYAAIPPITSSGSSTCWHRHLRPTPSVAGVDVLDGPRGLFRSGELCGQCVASSAAANPRPSRDLGCKGTTELGHRAADVRRPRSWRRPGEAARVAHTSSSTARAASATCCPQRRPASLPAAADVPFDGSVEPLIVMVMVARGGRVLLLGG